MGDQDSTISTVTSSTTNTTSTITTSSSTLFGSTFGLITNPTNSVFNQFNPNTSIYDNPMSSAYNPTSSAYNPTSSAYNFDSSAFNHQNVQSKLQNLSMHESKSWAGWSSETKDRKFFLDLLERRKLLPPCRIRLKDKLNYSNWSDWEAYMCADLRYFELDYVVFYDFDSTVKATMEFKRLDDLAKDQLKLNVETELKRAIDNEPTAKRMFMKLNELINGAGINKSIKLTMKLHQVLESSSNNLGDYTLNMQNIIKEFIKAYPSIPEEYWTGVFVGFIPTKFNYLRSNLCLVNDLSLNKAIEAVLQECQHVSDKSGKTLANCNLSAKTKETDKDKDRKQKKATNGQKKSFNKKNRNPKCSYCGGNHWLNQCEEAKKVLSETKNKDFSSSKSDNSSEQSANTSNSNQSTGIRMYNLRAKLNAITTRTYSGNSVSDKPKVNIIMNSLNSDDIVASKWYLDSGAARHMSNNDRSAETMNQLQTIVAQTADGTDLDTQGIGNYVLKAYNGLVKFNDVIYCKDLSASFISVGCLDRDCGYISQFGNQKCQIYDENDKLIVTGRLMDNNLYELNLHDTQKVKIFNLIAKKPDKTSIIYWHRVLGHLNFQYLLKLKSKLGFNESDVSNLMCTECILAKAPRLPFKSSKNATSERLELVHSDLSGTIRIPNQNKFNYYVTYTDDYSRYTVTFLMQSKTQTLDTFIEYQKKIELVTGCKIKCFRTDGGLEYMNHSFSDKLIEFGITKQTTCPSSPQQNAVAERINRTLTDMVISFFKSSGLSTNLWPYAVLYATRMKNLLPHSSIDYKIPFELFFNKKADYSNEHQWGEQVIYVGLTKENKYSTRNNYGNFIGIPPGTKGFYIYVPSTGKVIVSHDVYFLNRMNSDRIQYTESELSDLFDQQFTIGQSTEDEDVPEDEYQFLSSLIKESFDASSPDDELTLSNDSFESANSQVELLNLSQTDNESSIESLRDEDMPRGVIYLTANQRREFLNQYPHADLQFLHPVHTGRRNPPCKYMVNAVFLPRTIEQAYSSREASEWRRATDEEYLSHILNKSWEITDRPTNAKVLPCFWIFTVKTDSYGLIQRYKARVVILGNLQHFDHNELNQFTAPVINSTSIKFLLALAVNFGFEIRHLDAKTAFLHANLDQEVYMKQVPGYEIGGVNRVLRLKKSIYGLRISALNWYLFLRDALIDLGFKCCLTDNCIFYSNEIIIGIHVDDLIALYKSLTWFMRFLKAIQKRINIIDKGPISQCLSMNIKYDVKSGVMLIDQSNYIKSILEQFELQNARPTCSPIAPGFVIDDQSPKFENIQLFQQLAGLLLYLANSTRLDIAFPVNILCRHMSQPTSQLFEVGKRILRYLKGTIDYKLKFERSTPMVKIYADSDFGSMINDNKSISGCTTEFGNCTISWSCRKQKQISTSTCEAEVNSIVEAVNEAEYLNSIINELGFESKISSPFIVFNDNQSAQISTISGGKFQSNRHYRLRLGRIREAIRSKLIKLEYCSTEKMKADILTKCFTESRLVALCKLVGLDRHN